MFGRNLETVVSAILFTILISETHGANILGIFTSHSPSHLVIHMSMAKVLAERGHNVTVVSSMKSNEIPAGVKHILIEPKEYHKQQFQQLLSSMINRKTNRWKFFTSIKIFVDSQYELLLDPRFTALYQLKFDLVIVGYFMNVYQLGVAAKFKCPLIVSWVGGPVDMADYLTGNPSEIAYVPTLYQSTKHNEVWSFSKRLKNFVEHMWIRFVVMIMEYWMENYYNLAFHNEEKFPTYDEMKKKISLVFSNYHAISEGPIRPIVPSYIEIGGLQIKEKPNPLPKDIADFLNNAKDGAIILSFGSNIKHEMLKPAVISAMYKSLSNLKQHVIWKWDNLAKIPGNSSNILYVEWLPQSDILAHPNIKLFITHAGKGGAAEAQYHAVPILALPAFGDQFGLAESLVRSGFGLRLDLLSLTEVDFHDAVVEILNNPFYVNNVRKFSIFYRDRPLSAKQSLIYWTEYVLRHKGAIHLQTPLIHLNIIERNNLDVYALLIILLYVTYRFLKFSIIFSVNKLQFKMKRTEKQKNKDN